MFICSRLLRFPSELRYMIFSFLSFKHTRETLHETGKSRELVVDYLVCFVPSGLEETDAFVLRFGQARVETL